jgi:CBS domain-containing protein
MAETIDRILRNKGAAIWSVAPDSTVYDALALMAEKDIGALVVVSEGVLVGIVSERDYARQVILQGRSSKNTLVREIMTDTPVTVTPEHTVDDCMRIMTHERIRHLPVLDRGRLSGVVSIGDLVNTIIARQAQTIDELHSYIAGNYPN